MNEKLNFKSNLLIGTLLFGLFFGAGNLIFPVQMGQLAGENTLVATLGFLLTGVGLPILGVVASAVSRSESLYDMALPNGNLYAILFTCALYLTIGPLFAIPRTATVAFEVGLTGFIPAEIHPFALFLFSLIFFVLTLYFSLRPARILDWVGKYLTPSFIALLSILIIAALISPMGDPNSVPAQVDYTEIPFFTGLLEGYHTMDALASLAFAIVIISNVEKLGVTDPHRKAIETLKSSVVCLIGMGVIYSALAYMGASSVGSVGYGANGGVILSMISEHYFGFIGLILLAVIVFIACLKTAIGLITSCAQMFSEMFPNSLSYKGYAVLFTLLSFGVANFGLDTIIELSLPVLMFLYPLAITLIGLSLLSPFIKKQPDVYRWTTLFTGFAAFIDFLNELPQSLKENPLVARVIEFGESYLPGFAYGFGWVVPALLGFTIGIIVWQIRKRQVTAE